MTKFSKTNIFICLVLLLLIIGLITSHLSLIHRIKKLSGNFISIHSELVALKNATGEGQGLMERFLVYKSLPVENLKKLDFLKEEVLSKGKEEMAQHKAVFVGISRDNVGELPTVMKHIEYIGLMFKDYRIIVFENDSSDGTKLLFGLWQMVNPKVKVVSKDFLNKKRISMKFMADARNQYLDVLASKDYDDFDVVIATDMDMFYGIDVRGIYDSFSKIDRWDMVCSNGILSSTGKMYDAFAFRNEEFPYSPKEYQLKTGKDYWSAKNITTIQKIYNPEQDLIPVYSCFGGMALYKRHLFADCAYDSEDEDCEHVALHNCMRKKHNARIFLNPAQLMRYSNYR